MRTKQLILFILLFVVACSSRSSAPVSIPKNPSDPPWMRVIKDRGKTLQNAPGWTRARLSYNLKENCALSYQANITQERNFQTLEEPTSLPTRDNNRVLLRLFPENDQSISLSVASFPTIFDNAAPEGIRLDHFWTSEPVARLSSSTENLSIIGGSRTAWERLDSSLGLSIFFPSLSGNTVLVGEAWNATFQTDTSPPNANGMWMPWNAPTPIRFRLDSLYNFNGERVALIVAEWSREGQWSKTETTNAPIWQSKEIGQANFLWLADRGWPLLSEVFIKTTVEILSLEKPKQEYHFTFLGLSTLEEACIGPTLRAE